MSGRSWKSVTCVAVSSALAISLLAGTPSAVAADASTSDIATTTETSQLLGAIPPLCVTSVDIEPSEVEPSEVEPSDVESSESESPRPSESASASAEPQESVTSSPSVSVDLTTESDTPIEERSAELPAEPSSPSPIEEASIEESPSPSASVSASPSPSPSSSATRDDEDVATEPGHEEEADESSSIECPIPVSQVTASPGNNQVTVAWVSDSENTATSFFVVVEGEDRFVEIAAPATSAVVSGLRNGVEYTFHVIAAHADGSSEPSERVSATPTTGLDGEVAGLLVAFNPGSSVTNGEEVVPGEQGVDSVDLVAAEEVADNVHVVEFSESLSISEAAIVAQELTNSPEVEWAEPNQFVSSASDVVINDAEFVSQQWNLWDAYGVGVAQGADSINSEYTEAQGEGSTVAVIDTGIVEHPDLDDQVVPGYDFVSSPENLAGQRTAGGAEVPFDGDYEDQGRFGQVGWDTNPTDPGDWNQVAPIRDSSWHGTHVAGVIAAQEGNAEGVIGIAPRAKIQPIRALSWRGGLMSDIAAAITWASGGSVEGVGVNPNPSRVINMSFAMQGVCSNSLQAAIDGAFERGSVLIAAAGNANDDVANYAPANCENVISVGATGRDGKRAPYSNYGAGVDVSAPGGNAAGDGGVVSTSNSGTQGASEPAYVGREGTSIAAAHVAAIAARIMGQFPESKPADVQTVIVGRDAVRAFADASCDIDPVKTCGSGIAQIAAVTGTPGVDMNITVDDALIADGSTVAVGETVTVGSAALLSPGVGYREIRTTLDQGTVLASNSAVAPEGWAIQYSADNGSTWSPTQPTANTVTDVKASATVAAGLIEGTSQIYSSETTSAIPSSNFTASTGGDGWDTFFFEDYVFNIFHHSDATVIDCHYRSTGDRCTGYKATYGGYRASMRSGGWVDSTTGRLYAFTSQTSTNYVGALCVDVSQSSGPVSCGFIRMSSSMDSSYGWDYLTESEYVGRRFFGVAYGYNRVTNTWESQLMCYDAALAAVCANSPVSLVGGDRDADSLSNVRPLRVGDRIMVKTSTRIYCYVAATMEECSNQANWPVTITQASGENAKLPIAPHTTTTGTVDGVCYKDGCFDLTGVAKPTWVTPFSLTNFSNYNWAMHAVTGGLGGTRYFWAAEPLTVYCFDYATNAACTGAFPKGFSGYNLIYTTKPDPENPNCIWVNSDAGRISVFDALTGNDGCANNPVITLQPSQFAPRYACSTTAGITEWTTLRLLSIAGGGSAGSIALTVRDATGAAVSGWSRVPVTLGSELDMTGLNPAVSGSRPTFSFEFSSITGTISTANIALDYKGKGPELCVDTIATSATPTRNVVLDAFLTETVGSEETFTARRSFTIGNANALNLQSVPTAPLNLTGSGVNTTATLTFNEPSDDGNLELGDYQLSSDNGATWTDVSVTSNADGTLSTRVTGLTAGQTYTFRLAATNSLGRGATASTTITMQLATMDNLVDTPVNQGPVTLRPNTDQNLPLTYTSSTTSVCTVAANTVTLKTVGTCTIRAYNAGDSTVTPVIAAVDTTGSFEVTAAYFAPEVPEKPQSLTATPSSTQVALGWAAPLSDGNTPITDYVVQYKSGATWIIFNDGISTARSAVVPGLTNGTSYSFRVAAVNAEGVGSYTDSVSATPAAVPGAVTGLSASRGSTTATLTWTAPASNGGAAVSDYAVGYKLSSETSWTPFTDSVTATTGATVTGLTSGASYDFRVAAINAIGTGAYTSTANLTATGGNEQVALSWTQPTFTGGEVFSHYVVEYRQSGTSSWTTFSDSVATTSSTVVGLSNGTTYDFRVATVTMSSTSSYSSVATATPLTTPSAASDVAAIPGNRQVELTWSAPNSGGSAITDYIIQFKATSSSSWTTVTDAVSATTGVVITPLSNGISFDFRVAAVNAVGTGAYSATINATPRTTPGTPTSLSGTPGNASVALSWSAPSSDGGAAISDYVIQYRASTSFDWTTFSDGISSTTSATVVGLVNNVLYEFKVAAVNAAGSGSDSLSISSRPFTTPGDARSLTATVSSGTASLTWLAPTFNGGSAITDYAIGYKLSTASSWTSWTHTASTATSASIGSLTSGANYDFRVAAINAAGTGSYVSTVNLSVTPGDASAALSWPEPTFTGSETLVRYEVEYKLTSDSSWTNWANVSNTAPRTSTVTGLTNATSYDFRIVTVTSTSASSYSSVVSATPIGLPTAPQSLVATAGNSQVDLTWSAPVSNGGSAITDYRIQYRVNGTSSWTTYVDGTSTSTSVRVASLTNGTEYEFQVAALNTGGVGAYATAVTSQPFTVPGAPINLTATAGVGSVDLAWDAPTSNGGSTLTDYIVQYKASADASWTTFADGTSTTRTATISTLTNGTVYLFRVAATNAAGTGTESTSVSATPKTTPGAPTSLSATIGDEFVSLTWTAPADNGGSAITDYIVEYKRTADSTWLTYNDGTRTLPSVTVPSLTNMVEYEFRITSVNVVGSGGLSSTVAATPMATPDAPLNLSITYGNSSIAVAWDAPADDGGSPITDYVIQYRASSASSWTTASDGTSTARATTLSGLTNGTLYYIRVAAVNIAGTSSYTSALSDTPRTVPSAPSSPTAARGNQQITFTWTAPGNGGAAITDYLIEYKEASSSTWLLYSDSVSTSTSQVFTGLTNGTSYNFRVSAVNSEGTGSVSSTATQTPSTVPGVPTSFAVVPTNGGVQLSWALPIDNGGAAVSGYFLQYKLSSSSSWWDLADNGGSTSRDQGGLSNGTSYDFRVLARNVAGNGSYSELVTATPRTTPDVPLTFSVTRGPGEALLTWVAPVNNGGAAVTDYAIQYKISTDSTWLTFSDAVSNATSATVTGLVNGTQYDFKVAAVNPAGSSNYTSSLQATPQAAPSAPMSLSATYNVTEVDLVWSTPTSDGGVTITDYVIKYRLQGASTWSTWTDLVGTLTTETVTGLTPGASYEFVVYAINAVGNGDQATVRSIPPVPDVPATSAPVSSPAITSVAVPVELEAGEGAVLIDGVLVDISITPLTSASGEPTTWAVKGPGFSMAFRPEPVGSNGTLSGPSQGLRTIPGSWVDVQGDGYKGASWVKAYLILKAPVARTGLEPFITPRNASVIYLGEVEVLADGSFNIRVVVPESVDPGSYVLQINGLSPEAKTRSVNMALGVEAGSLSDVATRSVSRKAFFKPRSAKFSENGMSKLRTILANIPKDTKNLEIQVTGVSVSMSELRENLELAARRAERIVKYLQKHNVEGQYSISVETSMRFGSADRLTTTAKRTQKPLTTVVVEVGG